MLIHRGSFHVRPSVTSYFLSVFRLIFFLYAPLPMVFSSFSLSLLTWASESLEKYSTVVFFRLSCICWLRMRFAPWWLDPLAKKSIKKFYKLFGRTRISLCLKERNFKWRCAYENQRRWKFIKLIVLLVELSDDTIFKQFFKM